MALLSVTEIAGTLLTAIALGGMLFFAAVFTPLVFRNLSTDVAVDLINQVFPVYYTVLTGLTMLAALALWSRQEAPVLAVVAALFVFARYALVPRMTRRRDADSEGDDSYGEDDESFSRLHHLSAVISFAQMAALLTVFLRLVGG